MTVAHREKHTDNKRVLIIVNKWWECEPLMAVLLNDAARPYEDLRWPFPLHHPHKRPSKENARVKHVAQTTPRAVFTLNHISAEIWCISDLLEDLSQERKDQSSSARKVERIPHVFAGTEPSLVVAVGTAGYPGSTIENGSVAVGTRVFIHNAKPDNEDSDWNSGPFDRILDSALSQERFKEMTRLGEDVPKKFMVAPLNAASSARLIASYDDVSLGAANVTEINDYDHADKSTLESFSQYAEISSASSLETTHGLIRAHSEAPFMFVSGIVDRVGHFGEDVSPRKYAQNAMGAHNAGIVVAWMLPRIDSAIER